MPLRGGAGLNPRETAFVAHYEGAGTAEAAAHKAGFKHKNYGRNLLMRPKIREAILLKEGAKLQEAGRVQGRQLGKAIKVTRNDIINRADEISRTAESESARVAALALLVKIFGLSAEGSGKGDIFAGWTDEELEHYRITGELPARYGSIMGQGGSDPGASGTPAS